MTEEPTVLADGRGELVGMRKLNSLLSAIDGTWATPRRWSRPQHQQRTFVGASSVMN